ncbi:hypothetical protein NQ315_016530 [Exocentrus adspersus]|uniref:Uncharacterized protein n=1 Tax=Exocentrus adspersus TaxID=1586481 RepID=A0AAV8VZV5_9CUCU|nr:hypothetical protein NQ315_016530 [Exocentrus adspersus]
MILFEQNDGYNKTVLDEGSTFTGRSGKSSLFKGFLLSWFHPTVSIFAIFWLSSVFASSSNSRGYVICHVIGGGSKCRSRSG